MMGVQVLSLFIVLTEKPVIYYVLARAAYVRCRPQHSHSCVRKSNEKSDSFVFRRMLINQLRVPSYSAELRAVKITSASALTVTAALQKKGTCYLSYIMFVE